jgi:hypothetical protein
MSADVIAIDRAHYLVDHATWSIVVSRIIWRPSLQYVPFPPAMRLVPMHGNFFELIGESQA